MEVEVKPYDESASAAWDNFVRNDSRNGTIFHERNFLSYHQDGKFEDKSILLYIKDKLSAVIPAACIKTDNDRKTIVSHPGSSAGGIVFHKKANLKNVLDILETTISYYRANLIDSVEFRLGEPIFSYPSHDELTYLLWYKGFKIRTREISSCIRLDAKDWAYFGHERNQRYARSLGKTGIVIKQVETVDSLYPIIEKNLFERYNKHPTHTQSELENLKKKYPDKIDFWVVELNGSILAGAVIFSVNKFALHDFYHTVNYDFNKEHALTYLLYNLYEHYQKQGYTWFNFGISSRDDEIKWNILQFKESVGGRATFRENWILENLQK